MVQLRVIGWVKILGGIISVSSETGIPINNFSTWSEFTRWLDDNGYKFRYDYVYQYV